MSYKDLEKEVRRQGRPPVRASFRVEDVECEACAFRTDRGWIGHVTLQRLDEDEPFVRNRVVPSRHRALQSFMEAAQFEAGRALAERTPRRA